MKWTKALLLFLLFLSLPTGMCGQSDTADVKSIVPFWQRFSFHTNAMEWVLTIPNVGLEFDLGRTEDTRYSLLFTGKYNWQTKHTIQPRLVFNLISAQVEARKYWRTGGGMRRIEKRDSTVGFFQGFFSKFRHNHLSGRTISDGDARSWRAYYVGLYAGMDKYTINLSGDGKMGRSFNGGLSAGFTMPLYSFKGGSGIDFELGASAGLKLTKFWNFKYEEETACYARQNEESWHIVPFPVLHEVRVGVVYRFNSISNKVKNGAERYEKAFDRRQDARLTREQHYSFEVLRKDSIRKEHLRAKEMERIADSLDDVRKDSLKQVKRALKKERKNKKATTKVEQATKKKTVAVIISDEQWNALPTKQRKGGMRG